MSLGLCMLDDQRSKSKTFSPFGFLVMGIPIRVVESFNTTLDPLVVRNLQIVRDGHDFRLLVVITSV